MSGAHPLAIGGTPLSRQRWAIIAAELAVVGLLILVAYLTLLRSDREDSLFDIQAPGDGQRTAQGPTRGDRGPAPDGPESGEGRRADRGSPGIFDGGEGAEGRGALPLGGQPQGAPPGGGQSPTDDQYLDTLARLRAELNATEN